jgi:hypothetical protein
MHFDYHLKTDSIKIIFNLKLKLIKNILLMQNNLKFILYFNNFEQSRVFFLSEMYLWKESIDYLTLSLMKWELVEEMICIFNHAHKYKYSKYFCMSCGLFLPCIACTRGKIQGSSCRCMFATRTCSHGCPHIKIYIFV